uniref:Uncharacterized protein n=1 Tax=Anguilla anguilla TaxID=7936 RepID=A0A0E9XQ02_ANGAN
MTRCSMKSDSFSRRCHSQLCATQGLPAAPGNSTNTNRPPENTPLCQHCSAAETVHG